MQYSIHVVICCHNRELRRLELLMKLLRARGRHLPYGFTQCYLPPNTSEHTCLNLSQRPILDFPTLEGRKAELT